ncbi:hypothetical protein A3H65_03380 [Candidatus Giovannonibacteria bacterium RIFCSPLOWO2_02_FULL_45_14]|uniref:Uncharacterized protein n=1 Tax=Candidatus Giovannonibacteria bacterium RIFCSPLOWO2_12_FULL_44_15 TaxID=1798364 RepID=A0A1F5Y0V5_9BACT|nr:MAG: hypothetical protein A3C75_01575 [Candidatus Giovannonibacteria bacterium RIFCSPHIGHO2_02_FULL_44_31]OGF77041.1 MAG: hypothetical protein A3E62_00330 [Candidatus Giovannonibacteria bacterium RIFCSPHIGHO2_12_FULL_44_29]OGF91346.1 MAG: hypothetical protein A3H65_03380 [Candidatus Giovannonibacteria bacterium RIFCSPLOWO2_02_FULL_45_14]OGF93696.1 MAG: hypothetical protein A3G54_03630 [Candidatus Giovannonibacteria bacterium RIFCSPLOWO2_12_FULL_44_15]
MVDLIIALVAGIFIGGFLCYRLVEIEMGWQKLNRDEFDEICRASNIDELRKSKFCMASNFLYLVLMAVARDDLLERMFMALMMPIIGICRIFAEIRETINGAIAKLGRPPC